MSSPKRLANHYVRFFTLDAQGRRGIADNSPPELHKFAIKCRRDWASLYRVFSAIASGALVQSPEVPELLSWFRSNPDATERCDTALNSRQPPKTFAILLRTGYLAEMQELKNAVQTFLATEIAKAEQE